MERNSRIEFLRASPWSGARMHPNSAEFGNCGRWISLDLMKQLVAADGKQKISIFSDGPMLLMLEDDAERIERFRSVLRELDATLPLQVWRDAHRMIREVADFLPQSACLSLDHDLVQEPGAPDPGDGYLLGQWLTSKQVVRPVIIHSSNGERSRWMAGEFDLAGWKHWRVPPLGDDWIETDWRIVVRRLLRKHKSAATQLQ